MQYNYFSGAGDGKGSCDTSTTHFSHKVDFCRYRYDAVFITSHNHCIESPVVSSFSNYYSVGAAVGSSFVVADGGGKGIVVYSTTYLPSQKFYCWIYGGDVCHI